MMQEVTALEKRLIVAMDLGITIQHMDGHRYIVCADGERNFAETATNAGFPFYGKVYGSLVDALDRIDFVRKKMGLKSLVEEFDKARGYTYADIELFKQYETDKDHEQSFSRGPVFDPHYMK